MLSRQLRLLVPWTVVLILFPELLLAIRAYPELAVLVVYELFASLRAA
jgi:hypothetical protein